LKSLTWKVGELARQSGLSIRTLHYYEEIGLLRPSGRTEAGHRIYDEQDLSRLQRILSLRQLGFSLEEIQACLDKPEYALLPLVELHLSRLAGQITLFQRLHLRLSTIRERLQTDDAIPSGQILAALEAMTMLENYLTPAQIEAVAKLHEADRQPQGTSLRQKWLNLFEALTEHLDAGDDPASEPVQALARQWKAMVEESTKGDAELASSVARMYQEQPAARARVGMSDAVWNYVSKAFSAMAADPGD
jgi:DNA-binding transcriptional MerR regulator